MKNRTFELGQQPHLAFVGCEGDLLIQGWDKSQVELLSRHEGDAVETKEQDTTLEIASRVPLLAKVPSQSSIVLQGCSGDARIQNVHELHVGRHRGDLSADRVSQNEISSVHGDVSFRDSDSVYITALNGDLRARVVREKVTVVGVRGRVTLRRTAGLAQLQGITGDLIIRDAEGDVDVRDLTGDVKLSGNVQSGHHQLEVNGDAEIYLDPASNVHVTLEAPLGRIRGSVELNASQATAHTLAGSLGHGGARLAVLTHVGDIRFRLRAAHEWEDELWERAAARASREAERTSHLEEKLRLKSERLQEKARQRSERLAEAAEKRASRLRRWSAHRGSATREGGDNLGDERVAVLRMLAEGKISAEQAEALLEAMEG